MEKLDSDRFGIKLRGELEGWEIIVGGECCAAAFENGVGNRREIVGLSDFDGLTAGCPDLPFLQLAGESANENGQGWTGSAWDVDEWFSLIGRNSEHVSENRAVGEYVDGRS